MELHLSSSHLAASPITTWSYCYYYYYYYCYYHQYNHHHLNKLWEGRVYIGLCEPFVDPVVVNLDKLVLIRRHNPVHIVRLVRSGQG